MLIDTTYQPFISFFHQTEVVKRYPELAAIRKFISATRIDAPSDLVSADFGSALAIELRRAPPPDAREFLRFKFRNGTNEDFRTIHVFGHREDIPLTEFIYRLEVLIPYTMYNGQLLTPNAGLCHPQQRRVGSRLWCQCGLKLACPVRTRPQARCRKQVFGRNAHSRHDLLGDDVQLARLGFLQGLPPSQVCPPCRR